MSDDTGWRPLQPPSRPAADAPAQAPVETSPFVRLARVHATSAAGDAMIAVALAGSLFFSIDATAARSRVLLYLVLTMAPFAIVGPLIGPMLDRVKGGRRAMIIAINLCRVAVAFFMISNIDSLLLFPLAFATLVLGKSYQVAKSAIVPTTVRSYEELVEKNSRLSALSGIAGFVGAVPALAAQWLVGAGWAVAFAMVTFAVGAFLSFQLPPTAIAESPPDEDEKVELRGQRILIAASATGALRGIVGFLMFLIAFAFRGGTDDVDLSGMGTAVGAGVHNALGFAVDSEGSETPLALGVVAGATLIGMLVGALVAPRVRRSTPEENILLGALVLICGLAVFGAWVGGVFGGLIVAMTVGVGASAGKLAFDSIVQRDAPDANYGRSFARFETRFQVIWVLGALVPVAITIPARIGYLLIAVVAAFAAFSFFFGSRGRPVRLPAPLDPSRFRSSSSGSEGEREHSRDERWSKGAAKGPPRSTPDGDHQPTLWDDHR